MAKSQKTTENTEPRAQSPWDIYATDKKVEAEGVWLPYKGFELCIKRASASNPKFAAARAVLSKRYGRKIDKGILSEEKVTRMLAELYADHVVIAWKGVLDPEDSERKKLLPYTRENVIRMLVELPVVFDDVAQYAVDLETFRSEQTEEVAKN